MTLTKDVGKNRVSQVPRHAQGAQRSPAREMHLQAAVCVRGRFGRRPTTLARTSTVSQRNEGGEGGENKKAEDADTNRLQKHNNRERERA